MRAGELRHWVLIKNPQNVRNALGEYVETSSESDDDYGAYAAIRLTSAREVLIAGGNVLGQDVTHVITMRFNTTAKASLRLIFGDRTFEVSGIINVDECDIELQILAKEVL